MEQVLFLLIFAAVAIGKWVLDRASKEDEEPSRPAQPRQHQNTGEEEKMRCFMEALGQPKQQSPPSRPIPAQRPRPSQPPPLKKQPPPKPAPKPAPIPAPAMAMEPPQEPPQFTPREIDWTRTERAFSQPTPVSIAEQLDLRTPAALRRAVILREILGAPKGLQFSAGQPTL